jgi:hypothetical protein
MQSRASVLEFHKAQGKGCPPAANKLSVPHRAGSRRGKKKINSPHIQSSRQRRSTSTVNSIQPMEGVESGGGWETPSPSGRPQAARFGVCPCLRSLTEEEDDDVDDQQASSPGSEAMFRYLCLRTYLQHQPLEQDAFYTARRRKNGIHSPCAGLARETRCTLHAARHLLRTLLLSSETPYPASEPWQSTSSAACANGLSDGAVAMPSAWARCCGKLSVLGAKQPGDAFW